MPKFMRRKALKTRPSRSRIEHLAELVIFQEAISAGEHQPVWRCLADPVPQYLCDGWRMGTERASCVLVGPSV